MDIVKKYFMLFIIYSFLGWILEIFWVSFSQKKLVNRGILLGPYCPIYGCGCILLISCLDKLKFHPIYLFISTIVICSILEYLGSFILEKLFNARWWDYSHYRFNLNGRICLETMIPFGLMGTLVVYYINPILVNKINFDSSYIYIILFVFIVDIVVTYLTVSKIKNSIRSRQPDNTEEISKKVRTTLLKNMGIK